MPNLQRYYLETEVAKWETLALWQHNHCHASLSQDPGERGVYKLYVSVLAPGDRPLDRPQVSGVAWVDPDGQGWWQISIHKNHIEYPPVLPAIMPEAEWVPESSDNN